MGIPGILDSHRMRAVCSLVQFRRTAVPEIERCRYAGRASHRRCVVSQARMARVLFVSKPITPPFHDGSKCLVRDVSMALRGHLPEVMSVAGAVPLQGEAGTVLHHAVYSGSGQFSPSLRDNLGAAWWLATRARADIWHYVFAPNARTSRLGRVLRSLSGKPVVQTVASAPRSFDKIEDLLFGDVVVAQSRHTASRIADAYQHQRVDEKLRRHVVVIPPPVPRIEPPSSEQRLRIRFELGITESQKIVLFPGDLETGGGAERVVGAAGSLIDAIDDAVIVFAYRNKSAQTEPAARRLREMTRGLPVRFSSEISHMHALVASSQVVLFPVDDLWGKVDLPIVLLESMAFGVPVVVLAQGPLADLRGVYQLQSVDPAEWSAAAARLSVSGEHRESVIAAQHDAVDRLYSAREIAAQYAEVYSRLAPMR